MQLRLDHGQGSITTMEVPEQERGWHMRGIVLGNDYEGVATLSLLPGAWHVKRESKRVS